MQKIFLSIEEVEQLIFKKILYIPEQRTTINRAQASFSVAVIVDHKHFIVCDSKIVIFISGVLQFEIAQADQNLFLNHYHLPSGLISLIDRKVRDDIVDSCEEKTLINTEALNKKINAYTALRRAFIVIYHESLQLQKSNVDLAQYFISTLNSFGNFSSFKYELIFSILSHQALPEEIIPMKNKPFSSVSFYQWVWWGKFLVENLLVNHNDDSQIKAHKSWLKSLNPDNLRDDNGPLTHIPSNFNAESAIILGYYQAISNALDIKDAHDDVHKKSKISILNTGKYFEISFWSLFFKSLFLDSTDYIYPTKIIQDEFYKIEVNVYEIVKNIDYAANIELLYTIVIEEYSNDKLIKSYHALKDNVSEDKINIVDVDDVFEKFYKSPLFGKNRDNVGFIFSQSTANFVCNNYIQLFDGSFKMFQSSCEQNVIYYEESTSILPVKLRKKPLLSLIGRDKRVLFGIITNSHLNNLINIYGYIHRYAKSIKIEEIIFIWMVDKEQSQLHTAAFEYEKSIIKQKLESTFDHEVKLFTKNIGNQNDTEIIRFIKQSIGCYKFDEVEVIDSGFSYTQTQWLIDSTSDLTLRKENYDYSVFCSK